MDSINYFYEVLKVLFATAILILGLFAISEMITIIKNILNYKSK